MTHALGRLVRHDPRSRAYPYRAKAQTLVSVQHASHIGILDQGALGSCHDADTEILTRSGWLPFPDLTMGNELATVNPATRELTYERPTRVIALRYSGDMYSVASGSKDFRVTSDHSMLVRRWDESARTLRGEFELVPAKDLGWYSGLLTSVDFRGSANDGTYTIPGIPGYKRASQRVDLVVPMKSWLGFLGIYLAEGTMLQPIPKSPNKIQIAAFKDREKTFVRSVLADLGIHALELRDRFTFENGRVYRHLESLGLKGVYASEKFVPEFVFGLPAEDIAAFLAGHREGDGSFQNGCWTHHTSSPQLADDLQRLIFLAGGKTGMSYREPRSSVMSDGRQVNGRHGEYAVRHLAGCASSIERKKELRVEHYDGMVYCAEVPTHHTLVTRRNGKILISGNCTGNATVGALGCDPFWGTLPISQPPLDENEAVNIYSVATHLDDDPDHYPPTDTGSSGLAAAQAAQKRGLISGYLHAFTMADALTALQDRPVITGINWYSSFDQPSLLGLVGISRGATVRGGHEIVADGYDADKQLVWFRNSWGSGWGVGGRFCMTVATWQRLLNEQGDVTVFVPLTSAPPVADPDAALAAALRPYARLHPTAKIAGPAQAWLTAKGL